MVMDQSTIDDLKQFIAATISQQIISQTSELRQEIDTLREEMQEGFKKLDKKLSRKIDDLSDYIGDALDTSNEETDKHLKNHEVRIAKLESKAA
jgi:hypothetical protein